MADSPAEWVGTNDPLNERTATRREFRRGAVIIEGQAGFNLRACREGSNTKWPSPGRGERQAGKRGAIRLSSRPRLLHESVTRRLPYGSGGRPKRPRKA